MQLCSCSCSLFLWPHPDRRSLLLYCSGRSQWPSCSQLRGPPLCGPADACVSSMARVLAGKPPRASDSGNITVRDRDGDRDEEGGSFDCNICYDLAREPVVTLCGWVVLLDEWGTQFWNACPRPCARDARLTQFSLPGRWVEPEAC